MRILTNTFFNKDARQVAVNLLGKVLAVKDKALNIWLQAQIVETEAYYIHDKGSHASLGYTLKRRALFMPEGTIYMYYARGKPSLNFSCQGAGNAVLIKAGVPYLAHAHPNMLARMQELNPHPNGKPRNLVRLCAGQTLLCRALGLRVDVWDQQSLRLDSFKLLDDGVRVSHIVQATRLGIPYGRDEDLPYRFIDYANLASTTSGHFPSVGALYSKRQILQQFKAY